MAASTSVTDSLDSLDVELIKYSIILLGDLGVGKSSLFRRLNVNGFVEFDAATIGKAFCTVKTKTLENVVMEVHDTAGMERIGTMTKNYYLLADGAIIMYDLMQGFTVDNIHKWRSALLEYIPDALIMLLGNKAENLTTDETRVAQENYDKAIEIGNIHEIPLHHTISCKTGQGIQEAIEDMARAFHETKRNDTGQKKDTISLHHRGHKNKVKDNMNRYSKGEELQYESQCSC